MDTPQAAVIAYFDAINRGDAEASANTFAPDGTLMAHEVPTLAGKEVIREALKGMFQDMKVVARPTIDEVREDGDWAFVQTSSTGLCRSCLPASLVPQTIGNSLFCAEAPMAGASPTTCSTIQRAFRADATPAGHSARARSDVR
jgi:hypothetical protein